MEAKILCCKKQVDIKAAILPDFKGSLHYMGIWCENKKEILL